MLVIIEYSTYCIHCTDSFLALDVSIVVSKQHESGETMTTEVELTNYN